MRTASKAVLASIAILFIVSCADSLVRPRQCLDVVKETVPVPLHIGRLGDGGAVIVGFDTMMVVVTQATIDFSLSEDLQEHQLKEAGTCIAKLPISGVTQEYKIFTKQIGKVQ